MSIIINPKKVKKEELSGFRPLTYEEKRIYKQKTGDNYPVSLVLSFLFAFSIFGMIVIPATGSPGFPTDMIHHSGINFSIFIFSSAAVSTLCAIIIYSITEKSMVKALREDAKNLDIELLDCQVYEAFRCTDEIEKIYQVYIISGDMACKNSFKAIDFDFQQWLVSPDMHVLLFREKKEHKNKITYKYSVRNSDFLANN